MQLLAEQSIKAYRQLTQEPGFVDFFRQVTPIDEIVQLPIGSRPARRKAGGSLQDRRAIPRVFSWTQIRCLVPAWYGFGSAVEQLRCESPERGEELRDMYQHRPFFRATVDNAVLALAKTNLAVAEHYLRLAEASTDPPSFASLITAEYERSCAAGRQVTGQSQLLDTCPGCKTPSVGGARSWMP
jgi:phosphoenolpyruvate carboxylase